MEDEARFRIRSADGQVDKRNSGVGIHIALSADEKEQVEEAINQYAPGTPNGKFAPESRSSISCSTAGCWN